jgi:hypothetical protein
MNPAICVVLRTGLSIFPLSAILLLDFRTVPKVWFSLFFAINKNNPQKLMFLITIFYRCYIAQVAMT